MQATYTKLRTGWGIRVPGKIDPGATVTVVTKSGKSKSEHVSRVLWTGADKFTGQTISLCAIGQSQRAGGSRFGRRCYCAECGEPYRRGRTCWETGGECVPEWE